MVLVASPVAFSEVPEWLPVRCWWVPVCTAGVSQEDLRRGPGMVHGRSRRVPRWFGKRLEEFQEDPQGH